jgi:hypothetical protein
MPLNPSIHMAFCGVPVKKPNDWTVMRASAKRQKTMTLSIHIFCVNTHMLWETGLGMFLIIGI